MRRRPLSWRAELGRQVRRRRTLWSLGLLAALPLILVGAFAIGSSGTPGPASGTRLVDLATRGSANFTVFTLFATADFLLVVLAALFSGDTVPAEASWSTLRYLLTAPVARARLLASKLTVAVAGMVAVVITLPLWALLVGGVAYGWQPFTGTSGIGIAWPDFWVRLGIAVAFVAVNLLQVCGIAFLFGTLTDAPLGAVGGAVLVTILASILDAVEALGAIRNALPMHYSRAWVQAFAPEIDWSLLQRGAGWSVIYAVATVTIGFLVFRRRDIVS